MGAADDLLNAMTGAVNIQKSRKQTPERIAGLRQEFCVGTHVEDMWFPDFGVGVVVHMSSEEVSHLMNYIVVEFPDRGCPATFPLAIVHEYLKTVE